MGTTNSNVTFQSARVKQVVLITGVILSVPLIAMRFTKEVDWGIVDFLIMGTLISLTGLTIDWVIRTVNSRYKLVAILVIILVFLMIWVELATDGISRALTAWF